MAATGKTPILLYGSTTPTNTPSAGNLTNSSDGCEIAINVADKNLFFKDSTNAVNTVPIRQSSASSNGWLSSTDWSTFNSKQPAGTYVTSVTGTAPVVSSGGTTPAISMAAANGSTNGYLTSTDWTIFNGKAPAFTYTTGYIPFGQGTTTPTQDAGLFWDNTNKRLGVGTASPRATFDVTTTTAFTHAAPSTAGVELGARGATAAGYIFNTPSLNSTFNSGLAIDGSYSNPGGVGTSRVNIKAFGVASAGGYDSQLSFYTGFGGSALNENVVISSVGNLIVKNNNLVIGTSGKGIDFSATAGTGTSELLADYEEGTWTPTQGAGLTVVGSFSSSGTYTKVGRQVTVIGNIAGSTSVATSSGGVMVNGLPYTPATYCEGTAANVAGTSGSILFINSSTSIYSVSVIAATTNIRFAATYFV